MVKAEFRGVSLAMMATGMLLAGVVYARSSPHVPGPCVVCDGPRGPINGTLGLLGCASSGGLEAGEEIDTSRWWRKPDSLSCAPTSGQQPDCSGFRVCCGSASTGYFACLKGLTPDDCQLFYSCAAKCCPTSRAMITITERPDCGAGEYTTSLSCF